MATSAESLVREGITAFKSGNKDKARDLLMKAVEVDQYSEQGWLWLSAVVDSVEDQRTCLENVLAINPDNDRARDGLQSLIEQQSPSFGNSSSSSAGEAWPTPVAKPTGTSVEWGAGLETSSPSAYRAVPEPSKDDYDDWLSNLNLPAAAPGSPATPPSAAAFTAPFDTDDEDFGLDGPFSAPSVDDILDQLPPVSTQSRSDESIRGAFRSSAARAAEPEAPPPRVPARETSKTAPPREQPKPTREAAKPAKPAKAAAVDLDDDPFAGIEGDIDLNSTGLFTSLDEVDGNLEEMNADELFDYIPEDIKPTRLPGTIERYPAALIIALVLLLLLNVGAVALLVYKLT